MFIPLHDANHLRHIRLQYVTLAIIVVNSLIYLAFGTGLYGGGSLVRATNLAWGYIPAVANGFAVLPELYNTAPEWTKYVSYAFLHADFMHLAGNMLFIWVFGDNVEDAMGHLRFLAFFLLCAAAGALAHGLTLPDSESPLIGASGAAAGVITAYLMLHPRVKVWVLALGRIPLRLSALWVIGAWIAFQFLNVWLAEDDPVSWAAHVGGIVAGMVLLPVLKRRGVKLFDRTPVPEVIPPIAPPAVAEEGHVLPGQPDPAEFRERRLRAASQAAQDSRPPGSRAPWRDGRPGMEEGARPPATPWHDEGAGGPDLPIPSPWGRDAHRD